jgi:ABC-type phosphate transport system substrate-binding protein
VKILIKSWFVVLALLNPSLNAAVAQELAVIVNPAYEGELDSQQIERIYMGNLTVLTPYDLPDSSPLRKRFYSGALGKSMQQVNATRAKQVFSGRGRAPEELINPKAMKSVVASDPNAIGYVPRSAVDDSVKVLMVLGEETGGAREKPF